MQWYTQAKQWEILLRQPVNAINLVDSELLQRLLANSDNDGYDSPPSIKTVALACVTEVFRKSATAHTIASKFADEVNFTSFKKEDSPANRQRNSATLVTKLFPLQQRLSIVGEHSPQPISDIGGLDKVITKRLWQRFQGDSQLLVG